MNNNSTVKTLAKILGAIALIGYGIAIISILVTTADEKLAAKAFCLTSKCIKSWADAMDYPLLVAKATSDFLVAVATAGGIIVALLSYFSSVNNASLSNHISHYSTFQGYVNSEIGKRPRITGNSVDTFLWYNLIFPRSKCGDMSVSEPYKRFIAGLNTQLQLSNSQVSRATEESFRYKSHQERIQNELKLIGIMIPFQPRLEFYEIESEIFSLITCVNQAFCSAHEVAHLADRRYL